MKSLFGFSIAPVMAAPDAGGPAGFTTHWHNHGDAHQDNNNPGDTAADRHNFGNATAGKSDHKPTQGSAQDDFSGDAAPAGDQLDAMAMDVDPNAYVPVTDWDMLL